MNFQELLMRLSASCFAADRPDYDWKTLRLFPETGLDAGTVAAERVVTGLADWLRAAGA